METKIEETVISILKSSDMDTMTENKVRKMAGEKLNLDLSSPTHKKFIRNIVESFLTSKEQEQQNDEEPEQQNDEESEKESEITTTTKIRVHPVKKQPERKIESEEEEDDEEEEEMKTKTKEKEDFFGGGKEYDDEGNLIICSLSNKRRVTIQDFKGKTLVSIREYYEKDGKQRPSNKGISLTAEQWMAFSKSVPAIEESIEKMGSRHG